MTPQPGPVTVTVVSPAGAEGGAVFRVTDPDISGVTAPDGVVFVRQVGQEARVVLVRDGAGQLRFRMEVADIHRPPSVRLLEVSGPDDELRPDLMGYEVELEVEG